MLNGAPAYAILMSRQNGTTRRARLLQAVEGTHIRVSEQSLFRVLTLLVAVCEQTLLELDTTAQPGEDSDLAHGVAATLGAAERLLRSPRFAQEYSGSRSGTVGA